MVKDCAQIRKYMYAVHALLYIFFKFAQRLYLHTLRNGRTLGQAITFFLGQARLDIDGKCTNVCTCICRISPLNEIHVFHS